MYPVTNSNPRLPESKKNNAVPFRMCIYIIEMCSKCSKLEKSIILFLIFQSPVSGKSTLYLMATKLIHTVMLRGDANLLQIK